MGDKLGIDYSLYGHPHDGESWTAWMRRQNTLTKLTASASLVGAVALGILTIDQTVRGEKRYGDVVCEDWYNAEYPVRTPLDEIVTATAANIAVAPENQSDYARLVAEQNRYNIGINAENKWYVTTIPIQLPKSCSD